MVSPLGRRAPLGSLSASPSPPIAIAEIGDRTQLLSLALAAHYRTALADHRRHPVRDHRQSRGGGAARRLVRPAADPAGARSHGRDQHGGDGGLGAPGRHAQAPDPRSATGSAFLATLVAFFIAEIGDKTQIATVALAAAYPNLAAVVAGTTAGMLIANMPAVFLGDALSGRLPIRKMNYVALGDLRRARPRLHRARGGGVDGMTLASALRCRQNPSRHARDRSRYRNHRPRCRCGATASSRSPASS